MVVSMRKHEKKRPSKLLELPVEWVSFSFAAHLACSALSGKAVCRLVHSVYYTLNALNPPQKMKENES